LKHETGLEKNYKNFNTNQKKFSLIQAQTLLKLFGTISEELERRKLNEKYNELY